MLRRLAQATNRRLERRFRNLPAPVVENPHLLAVVILERASVFHHLHHQNEVNQEI
jgi:hypothetical protein